MVLIFNIWKELKKIEKYIDNKFAKSMSIYALIVIIINNILGHNSQLARNYNWKDWTTMYMMTHITTYGIGQDRSKIVKLEVIIDLKLNFGGLQILIGLLNSRKVFLIEEFKAIFME